MRVSRRWLLAALLACGTAAGCRQSPPSPPIDTGAREALETYYGALVRQDWPAAYAALDAGSRSRVSAQQFAALAKDYRRHLGFEPTQAQVRACEEHGAEATAHVTLRGKGATKGSYRDSITLRRSEAGWGVVLPKTFGQKGRKR